MPPQLPALTLHELTDELGSRTRALELLHWLHDQPALPAELPERIDGLSHRAWKTMRDKIVWAPPQVVAERQSPDGTTKFALRFGEHTIETVRIPAKGRGSWGGRGRQGRERPTSGIMSPFAALSRLPAPQSGRQRQRGRRAA